MTKSTKVSLAELKKIFPDFDSITSNWLSYATTHGHEQSKFERKILLKFVKIMKDLGVITK